MSFTTHPRQPAIKALAHVIGCHLEEIGRGEDLELVIQVIRYCNPHEDQKGREDPIGAYEREALIEAAQLARDFGHMIDRLLYPDEQL